MSLLVTTLPGLQTVPVRHFGGRDDLIDVVMASAHIPLVSDGAWWVTACVCACVYACVHACVACVRVWSVDGSRWVGVSYADVIQGCDRHV